MYLSDDQVGAYLNMYHLLFEEDIQKCAARADDLLLFECFASNLHGRRKCERRDGIRHVATQPLIHVLSAKVKSEKVKSEKDGQLAIYGEIYANYCDRGYWVKHELFKCEKDAPHIVGTNRILPLKGPDFSCKMDYGCMPLSLRRVRVVVKLFDHTGEKFEDQFFDPPANELIDYDGFESLGSMEGDAITLRYIVIPHGVSCRMKVRVFPRRHSADSPFYVNGRITAKYANTYDVDPFSEECVLFDKQGHESEQVIIDTGRLNLSRCWLALSAYSALVVDVDLSIIGTDKKIVGTAKMFPKNGLVSSDAIVVDDYMLIVDAAWSPPEFFPLPKFMKREQPSPSPSPALEILTVFIGFGQTEAQVARVYGSIELVNGSKICSIFKKNDENAVKIVSNWNSIPLLDGSRVLQDYLPLDMKVDVKDVDGSVAVKGFVDWDAQLLDTGVWHDKILCSIIRGQSGFVALHYAMFSKAVEAEIAVDLDLQLLDMRRGGVFWTLIAQYSCFNYSSDYRKKYHPIVLFKDFIDVPSGCWRDTVQLSRSKIVVPSRSSLVFVLTYKVTEGDDEEVRRVCKIGIGEGSKKVEATGCGLLSTARIGIEWKEIQ